LIEEAQWTYGGMNFKLQVGQLDATGSKRYSVHNNYLVHTKVPEVRVLDASGRDSDIALQSLD
jgi:hypothetical protein